MVIITVTVSLLLILGFCLSRNGLVSPEGKSQIEKLCYYIFFPILIFNATRGGAELSDQLSSFIPLVGVYLILAGMLTGISLFSSGLKSVGAANSFQLIGRQNGFISLYIITIQYGDLGIATAGLLLIPLIITLNFISVSLFLISSPHVKKDLGSATIKLLTNPFILASFAGFLFGSIEKEFSLSEFQILEILLDNLERPALTLGIITVGASFAKIKFSLSHLPPIIYFSLCKLIMLPLLVYGISGLAGWQGFGAEVLFLIAAAPSATASYLLALKYSDQSESSLVSTVVFCQTILSVVSIPLVFHLKDFLV